MGEKWPLAVVLPWPSLMTEDAEHLSTCSLAVCVSSLETCPFGSFQVTYSCSFIFPMEFRFGECRYKNTL